MLILPFDIFIRSPKIKNNETKKKNCFFFANNSPTLNLSAQKNPKQQKLPIFGVFSKNLIKGYLFNKLVLSSGILSKLLLQNTDVAAIQAFSWESLRKEWSVWVFKSSIISNCSSVIGTLSPWSIRTRRLFTLIGKDNKKTLIISYVFQQHATPKRRIKRWLKKKYTTTSWR